MINFIFAPSTGANMARKKKEVVIEEVSTEEKIKRAANKLFTERGYDAVKTRDIAKEAGINLALLNYYFKSKENLYQEVIYDNFRQLIASLMPIMSDESIDVMEVLEKISASYIDVFLANPDLPVFVLNSIRGNAPVVSKDMNGELIKVRTMFLKRLMEAFGKDSTSQFGMINFMINFMGMVIFPFMAKPVLMKANNISEKEFVTLMQERKAMLPRWFKAMAKSK
jgi:AcrR family transcriptional regulator